jgi:uncharacterized protein
MSRFRFVAILTSILAGSAMYATAAPPPSALIDAAREDDEGAVRALIAQHLDVNARAADGMTALNWAAMRTNLEIARDLLKAAAKPDQANVNGVTPLSLAILNGSDPLVELLLANGANPNAIRDSGETPLMTATRMGRVETIKILLSHGASVNASERHFGQTALMWAAGTPDAVRLLLEHKANIHAVTKSWDIKGRKYGNGFATLGRTGIPWVSQGEYDTKAGGYDALLFAVEKHDMESAEMLVAAGADVNRSASDGATPLLLALYKFQVATGALDPDLAMATFLLDRGAKPNTADLAGYTPLHGVVLAIAAELKRKNAPATMPRAVPPKPVNVNPIAARVAAGVVARRGGITKDAPQLPELMAMAKRLLDAGADANRKTLNPTPGPIGDTRVNPTAPGSSAFHVAASVNNVELMRLFEEHGANPNILNQEGHSPFSIAVKSGNLDDVKEMAGHGADLAARYNPQDMIADPVQSIARPRKGETIMHIAVVGNQVAVIQFLYSLHVPLELRNEANETPLMLADSLERFEMERAKENGRAVPRSTVLTSAIEKLLADAKTVSLN